MREMLGRSVLKKSYVEVILSAFLIYLEVQNKTFYIVLSKKALLMLSFQCFRASILIEGTKVKWFVHPNYKNISALLLVGSGHAGSF